MFIRETFLNVVLMFMLHKNTETYILPSAWLYLKYITKTGIKMELLKLCCFTNTFNNLRGEVVNT